MPNNYIFRSLSILLVCLVCFSLFLSPSLALVNNGNETQIVEIADEALKLNLATTSQDYPGKTIQLTLTIDPKISSGKATVNWIYDENIYKIIGASQDIISVTTDSQVKLTKSFTPTFRYTPPVNYTSTIGVRVSAAAFDRNYISVRKLDFKINPDYELIPELANYSQTKMLYTVFYVVIGIIITGILGWGIYYGVKRFRIYLNTD